MRLAIAGGLLLLGTILAPAHAQSLGSAAGENAGIDLSDLRQHDASECATDGVANGGYDLVSYRMDGGPRFGSAEFPVVRDGLTYLFETEANRRQFVEDPEFYLPAYSGWCAVTLALGRLSCPDYTNFKIENDRLLLFELTGFTNGQSLWNSDPGRFRGMADDNYSIFMESQ